MMVERLIRHFRARENMESCRVKAGKALRGTQLWDSAGTGLQRKYFAPQYLLSSSSMALSLLQLLP